MIYHITRRADWEAALVSGSYRPPSLEREGFIHFSARRQLLLVANAFYRGHDDLVVLCVPPQRVAGALRWEAPDPAQTLTNASSDRFPHLYQALATSDVAQVVPLTVGDDGFFALPHDLPDDTPADG